MTASCASAEASAPYRPLRAIVRAVAARHALPADVILGDTRRREVTVARREVYWLAWQLPEYSLARIGREMRRDHTTVMHGARVVDQLAEGDPDYAAELRGILTPILAARAEARRSPGDEAVATARRLLAAPVGEMTLRPGEVREMARALVDATDGAAQGVRP